PHGPALYHTVVLHLLLSSFPTRRSSDLFQPSAQRARCPNISKYWLCFRLFPSAAKLYAMLTPWIGICGTPRIRSGGVTSRTSRTDRKSTRLNSSHVSNSYAVFCLKKKNW